MSEDYGSLLPLYELQLFLDVRPADLSVAYRRLNGGGSLQVHMAQVVSQFF